MAAVNISDRCRWFSRRGRLSLCERDVCSMHIQLNRDLKTPLITVCDVQQLVNGRVIYAYDRYGWQRSHTLCEYSTNILPIKISAD